MARQIRSISGLTEFSRLHNIRAGGIVLAAGIDPSIYLA